MINSVSNVSFKGEVASANNQDLINQPGRFTSQTPEIQPDSYEGPSAEVKKKGMSTGAKAAIGVLVAGLAAFAGLGYAVKSGKLAKVEIPAEGFFAKTWTHVKNAAASVGEAAGKCWDTVAGWFGKGAKEAEKVADEVVETVA